MNKEDRCLLIELLCVVVVTYFRFRRAVMDLIDFIKS